MPTKRKKTEPIRPPSDAPREADPRWLDVLRLALQIVAALVGGGK